MDITRSNNTKQLQLHPLFSPNMEVEPRNTNPFTDSEDPLNRINLKEKTSNLIQISSSNNIEMGNERRESFSSQKSIGEGRSNGGQRRVLLMESPSTPGRGVFSFSKRRNFPSKWIDAEKWLTSGHESPANSLKNTNTNPHFDGFKNQVEVVYSEKSRVTEEKVSEIDLIHQDFSSCPNNIHGSILLSPQDLLKDKLADEVQQILPMFKSSDPLTEGFLFRDPPTVTGEYLPAEKYLRQRDIGTEMTPIGSLATSRCHTPFKSSSPARHNTPSKMSGPVTKGVIDISEFADKLRLSESGMSHYDNSVTTHWNSREEEEEEISKSLRHFDMEIELRRSVSVSETKSNLWDEDEKIKFCQRYQREEAKIQAWVNLQNAKAEAQSRKLEVKIQKMRSNLEEKLMKRMAAVDRRAEEWRSTARLHHIQQMQRAAEQARKLTNRRGYVVSGRSSCGCLPCNNIYS